MQTLDPNAFILHHDIKHPLIRALLASGLFEDTGKVASYGFVFDRPVWKLLKED